MSDTQVGLRDTELLSFHERVAIFQRAYRKYMLFVGLRVYLTLEGSIATPMTDTRRLCDKSDLRYTERVVVGYVSQAEVPTHVPTPVALECFLYDTGYAPIGRFVQYAFFDCIWLCYTSAEYSVVYILLPLDAQVDRIIAAFSRDRRKRLVYSRKM